MNTNRKKKSSRKRITADATPRGKRQKPDGDINRPPERRAADANPPRGKRRNS